MEVVWAKAQNITPPDKDAVKDFICYCYYSPPRQTAGQREELAAHITMNMNMILTKYPDAGTLICGDTNGLKTALITDFLEDNCQIVNLPTNNKNVLDVIITNMGEYYETPTIHTPLQPDDPMTGKESDHNWVSCFPKSQLETNNNNVLTQKTFQTRAIPESLVPEYCGWVAIRNWEKVLKARTADEKLKEMEKIANDRVDIIAPLKTVKMKAKEWPWSTEEIKKKKEKRQEEWRQHNKSKKWKDMDKEIKSQIQTEKIKFTRKLVLDTRDAKGAARALKEISAGPLDTGKGEQMTLKKHLDEGLTDKEQANDFAQFFSSISKEYAPVNLELLRPEIAEKIQNQEGIEKAPAINEQVITYFLKQGKNSSSTVPGELPHKLRTEALVLLAEPITDIWRTYILGIF